MAHFLFRPRHPHRSHHHHHRARFRAPPPALFVAALASSYNSNLISSDFSPTTTNWGTAATRLCRGPDGYLWAVYCDSTKRYVRVNHSTDGGNTWPNEETVYDTGQTTHAFGVGISMGRDGVPRITVAASSAPYISLDHVKVFEKQVGVWTDVGLTLFSNFLVEANWEGFQGTDSRWYFCIFTINGGNSRDRLIIVRTESDWTGGVNIVDQDFNFYIGNFQVGQQQSADFAMDKYNNIHVVAGGVLDGGASYGLMYAKWTYGQTSTSVPFENVVVSGASGVNLNKPLLCRICVDHNMVVHVLGHWQGTGAGAGKYQPWYAYGTSGSWSAKEHMLGGERAFDAFGELDVRNDFAQGLVQALGYGVNTTKYNLQFCTRQSGSWARYQMTDDSTDWSQRKFGGGLDTRYEWSEYSQDTTGAYFFAFRGSSVYLVRYGSPSYTTYPDDPYVHMAPFAKKRVRRPLEQGRRLGVGPPKPRMHHPPVFIPWPFRRTTIVSAGTVPSSVGWSVSPRAIRSSDGKLWVVYHDTTKQYFLAKYSLDNGLTWSSPETVYDTAQTTFSYECSMTQGNDGRPVVIVLDTTTNFARFFRRESGVWTAKATLTIDAADESALNIAQSPDGVWHAVHFQTVGGTTDRRFHVKSTDDLTSWTSTTTKDYGNAGGALKRATQGSYWFVMTENGDIHLVSAGYLYGASSSYGVNYEKYDYGSDTWGSVETAITTGVIGDVYYKAGIPSIAVDVNGKIHITANYRNADFTSVYTCFYTNNVSGSWLSAEQVPSKNLSTHQIGFIGIDRGDGVTPYVIWIGRGYQTTLNAAFDQLMISKRIGGAWVRYPTMDLPYTPAHQRPIYNPRYPWATPARGLAWIELTGASSPYDMQYAESTDVGWQGDPAPAVNDASFVRSPLMRIGSRMRPFPGSRFKTADVFQLSFIWTSLVVLFPRTVRPNEPPLVMRSLGRVWFGPKHFLPQHIPVTGYVVGSSVGYDPSVPRLVIRAWVEGRSGEMRLDALSAGLSYAAVVDEEGVELSRVSGSVDPAGLEFLSFDLPVKLAADHRYRLNIVLSTPTNYAEGQRSFPLVTVR